jgi:cytochrome P460
MVVAVTLRVLVLGLLVALAASCGGSGEPEAEPAASTPPTTTEPAPEPTTSETEPALPQPEPEAAPLPGLPEFTAGYTEWFKLNDDPIPPRESGDAHLGTKNVYTSIKAPASGPFRNGTIVVKEASRPGKDFIGLIATMRKNRGADPAHNDWVFVEWTREGADAPFTETASGAVCWSCHMGAADKDYVFTR